MDVQINEFLLSKSIVVPKRWLIDCIEFVKSEYGFQGNVNNYDRLKESIYEQWKHADLEELKTKCLPADINSKVSTILKGSFVVQMNKIKDIGQPAYSQLKKLCAEDDMNSNISADKQFISAWEPKPSRMLLLELTDGTTMIKAMEYKPIKSLSLSLQPGVKILLKGMMEARRGIIMLSNHHVTVLGGEVDSLLARNALENVLRATLHLEETDNPREVPVDSIVLNQTINETQSQYYNTQSTQRSRTAVQNYNVNNDNLINKSQVQSSQNNRLQNCNNFSNNTPGTTSNQNKNFGFSNNDFNKSNLNNINVKNKTEFNDNFKETLNDSLEELFKTDLETDFFETVNYQNQPDLRNSSNLSKSKLNARSSMNPSENNIIFNKPVNMLESKADSKKTVISSENFGDMFSDDEDFIIAASQIEIDHNLIGNHNDNFNRRFNDDKSINYKPNICDNKKSNNVQRDLICDSKLKSFEPNNLCNLKLNKPEKPLDYEKKKCYNEQIKTQNQLPHLEAPKYQLCNQNKPETQPVQNIPEIQLVEENDSKKFNLKDSFKAKLSQFKRKLPVSKPDIQSENISSNVETTCDPVNCSSDSGLQEKKIRKIDDSLDNSVMDTNVSTSSYLSTAIPSISILNSKNFQSSSNVKNFTPKQDNSISRERSSLKEFFSTSMPYQYLCYIDFEPPTSRRYTIKGFVTTLLSKLEQKNDEWSVMAKINDGTASRDVLILDQVLSELMGMTLPEYKRKKQEVVNNPELKARLSQNVSNCQRELISMCCLLTIEVEENSVPKLVEVEKPNGEHLEQLKRRSERFDS